MRLTSMTIKNFKGIGEKAVTINFAPITMLFGPNNAGKSTVIQALHLAREVFCEHEPDFDRVAVYGEGMNLGAFRDYVHEHDTNKVVRIKLDWDNVTIPPSSAVLKHLDLDNISEIDDLTYDINSMGIEIGIAWNYALEKAVLKDFTMFFNGKEFTTIDIIPNHNGESAMAANSVCYAPPFINLNDWDAVLKDIQQTHGYSANGEAEEVEAEFFMLDRVPEIIGIILYHFVNMKDLEEFFNLSPESEDPHYTFEFPIANGLVPQWGQYLDLTFKLNGEPAELAPDDPTETLTLYSKELFTRLISMAGKRAQDFLNNFLYIGPIRKIPPRGVYKTERITHERWSTGLAAWDEIAKADSRSMERLNKALTELELGYSLTVESTSGSAFNREEKRKDINDFFEIAEPLSKEELTDAIQVMSKAFTKAFKEDFVPIIQKVLQSTEEIQKDVRTFIRIVFVHSKTSTTVEPQDMGLGVSQIIPFIVAATLAKKDAFIAVEQPELHIHPKLQVNLGDVVIQAALQSENRPIFLIETHSEHLLLRFLRRIRQTNEERAPEGLELTPEQITINWIGAKEKQTYCLQLDIGEDGSFNTPWPEGFFGERGEELFG